ncbi:MAG: hypothetical protein MJ211_00705 [Bacteroidales bacterium]|nr:hypothetical protein [Bacteroidales bacterium]
MKKTFNLIIAVLTASLFLVACGGSSKEFSAKEKMLMDKNWVPNLNANLKSDNQALEESTGIKSDFQLGGDVEKIGNFLAGKYLFGLDSKTHTDQVYSITAGQGILSTTTGAGKWQFSEDEKYLLLTPWDYDKNEYKSEPTKYEIIELTENKLVWKQEGASTTSTFECN